MLDDEIDEGTTQSGASFREETSPPNMDAFDADLKIHKLPGQLQWLVLDNKKFRHGLSQGRKEATGTRDHACMPGEAVLCTGGCARLRGYSVMLSLHMCDLAR